MDIEQLLSYDAYHYSRIHAFVAAKGLSNVTVTDLDRIVGKYGHEVMGIVDFFQLYSIVSTNDANRVMKRWSLITGVCTIVVTVATVLNLVLFLMST